MGKLHMRDLIGPGTRVGPTEDPKVGFNLLVDTFRFAIELRVVDSGEREVIVQEFSKFLDKGGGELWAMIGDDFIIESEMEVHLVKEKGSYPFSGDRFLGGAENYPLCKAMVDYNQQGVKTGGGGEVGDEVARDLLEGARGKGFDRSEWGDSGVSVQLVLLAHDIALNVFVHKLCKTGPPEFRGNKLASFQIARVLSGLMIVATGKDRVAEGVPRRNLYVALVSQDVVIVFPVREARLESSRNILQGQL